MMKQIVREVARKHNLTHARTFDMLVDFLESLIEADKIVTQDLIDYFEEEIVEAAQLDEQPATAPAPEPEPTVETDRLDADTKEIVSFLLSKLVRVDTPVQCRFIGDKKAVVKLRFMLYATVQVAVVTRVNGKLTYRTVTSTHPFANTK